MSLLEITSYLPYFFLAAAIVSLWVKRSHTIWGILLLLAIISGLVFGRLQWVALPALLGMGGSFYIVFCGSYPKWLKITSGIFGCVLSILLSIHLLPGFNNLKIISETVFSPHAHPYSLYLNFDKPLVGLFILGFGWAYINKNVSLKILTKIIPLILLTLITLIALSIAFNYVRLDLKYTPLFWIWALTNLFACISEEALFRGIIQNTITRTFPQHRLAPYGAIVITAILFGLMHFSGGLKFIFLSFIAGLFYGLAYQRTGRLEASILTHFALNVTHFLGFTYPALKAIQ